MSSTIRTPVAWALIGVFLTVVCVGDALHFLPGCGHGVWVEDGLLLLGISLPKAQLPAERPSCAKRPEGPDIPIYGEDECAICAVTGQHSAPTDSAQLFLALPLKPAALRVVLCDVDSEAAHPFQARAPPLV